MALTLTEANRMIQAAVAKAQELNVKISVAVCDIGGNLVALNRMDGASAVRESVKLNFPNCRGILQTITDWRSPHGIDRLAQDPLC